MILQEGGTRTLPMAAGERGFFEHTEPHIEEGTQYFFRLDGGELRQDPYSLWQPKGVPGPSAVLQPANFRWTDGSWRGVRRGDLVFYELHVGTFTPDGTFDAIIPRLESLRALGVTAIELMPIGQFPGSRNWGYDGVLPYAAQNTYGGPQGLQRLVDACHAAGVAIFLDVVYNHLGPEANYLQEFGPYFTDRFKTPWGTAINYDDRDCDPVRDWAIDNARMWLEEFHVDGLRLDAVHAICDLGAKHILRAIRDAADEVTGRTGRPVHIVAESDLNDPRIVTSRERGGYGIDAQWSDDFHHAVHSVLSGEMQGYYADYGRVEHLAAVLNTPFLNAGEYSSHRGRKHGAPPTGLSGDQFVVAIQNHDQVGNRAVGDRLSTLLANPAKLRLAACLMLFSPHLPLLFMGEEYGETRPFPFFCSFNGKELTQAVRQGRRREFAAFVNDIHEVPDPGAEATYLSAKLSWAWPEGSEQGGLRHLYADLLAARRQWLAMREFNHRLARLLPDAPVVQLIRGGCSKGWQGAVEIYFNLSDRPQDIAPEVLAGGSVMFASEAERYRGARRASDPVSVLLPFECVAFGRRAEDAANVGEMP